MNPLSMRIYYHSYENSLGHSALWFAASRKQQIRDTLNEMAIDPKKVYKFEVKENGVYVQKDLKKFLEIFEGGTNEYQN